MSNEQKKEMPTWKLVQEKAYYGVQQDGRSMRKTKTLNITVGWDRTSKDGMQYISFADSLQNITADVDGKIKLILFPITNNDQAQ